MSLVNCHTEMESQVCDCGILGCEIWQHSLDSLCHSAFTTPWLGSMITFMKIVENRSREVDMTCTMLLKSSAVTAIPHFRECSQSPQLLKCDSNPFLCYYPYTHPQLSYDGKKGIHWWPFSQRSRIGVAGQIGDYLESLTYDPYARTQWSDVARDI